MGCYLCAYQKTQTPKTVQPLPPTSPGRVGDELGTCWRCSISACAAHGTLYGRFECAICTPAVATQQALAGGATPPAGGTGSAGAFAGLVGQNATQEQLDRVGRGIDAIARDYSRARDRGFAGEGVAEKREPNLVSNLAGFVSAWGGPAGFVPEVRAEGFVGVRLADEGGVSLDAVSAAARNAFAQVTLDPEQLAGQVPTVTGALLLAAVVAHKQPGPDDMPESLNPGAVEIPPPWEMSYPVLLDPLMWVVATAYHARN